MRYDGTRLVLRADFALRVSGLLLFAIFVYVVEGNL